MCPYSNTLIVYKKAYKKTPFWNTIKKYEFNGSNCALHSVDIWGYNFVFMGIFATYLLFKNLTK